MKTKIEELKQEMVRRYQQRIEEFRQNRIFDFNQKKMYAEFNEDGVRPSKMYKKVRDFGVIFGASGKGITEKHNG